MKRTDAGKPYLSWCLIVRNCEKMLPGALEKCLQSIRTRTPQAEIVIVDTCSSDENTPGGGTVEIAKRYADVFEVYKGPDGDWTKEMEWFDDAAAARQHSFKLASGRWVGWCDADDELPGPEEVLRLLKLNGKLRDAPERGFKDMKAPEAASLEDLLRLIEETDPTIDCVNAPYLYRSEEDGRALIWQERERIVLWERGFKWVEPGHEFLAPDMSKPHGRPLDMPALLFVHKKKWTTEDAVYSTRRHYEILVKKYDEKSDRSIRTIQYLCSFAPSMCPQRHQEFARAGVENAVNFLDRYVAHICLGEYQAAQGLYLEAQASFGAAVVMRPDLPNAYFSAAMSAFTAEDWPRTAHNFRQCLAAHPDYITFPMNPREFTLSIPLRAASALQRLADQQVKQGMQDIALESLRLAYQLAAGVVQSGVAQCTDDLDMVNNALSRSRQLMEAQEQALSFHRSWDFLRRHDESTKILDLIKSVPYTITDHPIVNAIRDWAKPLELHLTDEKAYGDFYNGMDQNDAIPTHLIQKSWLTPEGCLPRTRMVIDWLTANYPEGEVLELGPYDGINVIPILMACPKVRYTAVDANQDALDRILMYATEVGVQDRLTMHRAVNADDVPALKGKTFNAVILFEVIEHVQNPDKTVAQLLDYVSITRGRLFMSTPWGAFDNGSPDESKKPRDARGHVRAMLQKDMVDVVEAAGGRVETLFNQVGRWHYGDTMHVVVKHVTGPGQKWSVASKGVLPKLPHIHQDEPRPIVFVVPAALWEWNASHVIQTGIGMSEESIVYLARELAKDSAQRVMVYGPVPSEEVNDGVQYWPLEKLRYVPANAKVVISRSPGFLKQLEAVTGNKYNDAVLWLQDAGYPDLNAETAALYKDIVILTQWHADVMHAAGVPQEKMTLINNFLLSEHFTQNGEVFRQKDWAQLFEIPRRPFHFIYASSPDRGLVTLLRLWPAVLKEYPEATLSIFYGWEGCMKLSAQNQSWGAIYKKLRSDYEKVRYQKGVVERGRVNHHHLAAEYMLSSVFSYPTSFAETGCCSVAKAMASGAVPVTTPYAGLAETGASPWTQWIEPKPNDDYQERFMAGVKYAIELPHSERVKMAQYSINKFELRTYALPLWKKILGAI